MPNKEDGANESSLNKHINGRSSEYLTVSDGLKRFQYKDLHLYFRHMFENKAISIIPFKSGAKKPTKEIQKTGWTKYRTKQYPLHKLKRKHSNYAIVCGDPLKWGMGYLTILDIDDKELYPLFKDIDTLHVKSSSKGYHLYFWSDKEVKDVNYVARLFNVKVELRGTDGHLVMLPPSNIDLGDGKIGCHEIIKTPSEGFSIIKDVEDVQETIIKIFQDAGYIPNTNIEFSHTEEDISASNLTHIASKNIRWERTLKEDEILKIVGELRPLYNEGYRQNICLYLSGWLKKAEVSFNSAQKVIELLSYNESEKEVKERLTTLKYSYRGLMEQSLKGSSGIYQIIKSYYEKQYSNNSKEEREELVETDTKNHYKTLKNIIVHPLSILGINSSLKAMKHGVSENRGHIKRIHRFLRNRFHIYRHVLTDALWIYQNDTMSYDHYNDRKFQEFLYEVFNEEIFTMAEAKTIESMFSIRKEESKQKLSFRNCFLNLETMKTEPFDPEEFVTFRVSYSWNPQAKGGLVEEKLKDILIDKNGDNKGNEDKYIQFLQMGGYCLAEYGNPRQKLFLIYGGPGTGKTQLVQLLVGLFPQKVSSVPLQNFKNKFGLSPLLDKKINTLSDISKEEINNPAIIKAVTGGDSITIDRKYKDPVTLEEGMPIKTIGSGNELPKINDLSKAMFERIIKMELKNKFRGTSEDEKELYKTLLEDEEGMSWFIYRCIEEYRKIKDSKQKFKLEISSDEMVEEYLKISDPCSYAGLKLFEKTNDERDFYPNYEIIQMMTDLLKKEGLRIPSQNTEYYNAIKNIGGEKSRRRTLDDKEYGFMLIKAKDVYNDPQNTRIKSQSIIEEIEGIDMKGTPVNFLTPIERQIIGDVVKHTGDFKNKLKDKPYTIAQLLDDLLDEDYTREQIKNTLELWKQKGYLKINNSSS